MTSPTNNPVRRAQALRARPWELAAWVSGAFCVFIALFMLTSYWNARSEDPLQSAELKQLREQLRERPTDESLKQKIRALDLDLRQTYFKHIARMKFGVHVLLGGSAAFLFAATRLRAVYRQPPLPQPRTDAAGEARRAAHQARWSVAVSGIAVGGLLFLISLGLTTALPRSEGEINKLVGGNAAASPVSDAAPLEEWKRNWPRFLGPNNGFSPVTNLPVKWDAQTKEGIAWKTPSPGIGFNSPLVWEGKVFFSGGDAEKREVFCLDLKKGDLLWRQPVPSPPGTPAQPPEIPDSTGYAPCTMATDGRRVYVIFANGDTAAFTLEGKPVWSKGFGALKNPYGHASSLATWRDRLIVLLDQGDSEEGKSRLYALDGRTGQVVWQKPRKVGASWATPIVFEAAGKTQIVALAVPFAIAYSATDGAELWRVDCLNGEVTPSPIFAGGLVIVPSPSEKLTAIRPDGQGDVTKSHVVWTTEENVPDVSSPTSNGELVFTITTFGMMTCFDIKDGKKLWEHEFEMECHASPVIAGDRVYLFGQKGVVVVVEAARQFKEVFRTKMEDEFHATPAFAPGRIVARGTQQVWGLGH